MQNIELCRESLNARGVLNLKSTSMTETRSVDIDRWRDIDNRKANLERERTKERHCCRVCSWAVVSVLGEGSARVVLGEASVTSHLPTGKTRTQQLWSR